ncbi:endo-alpha-N-acetylgalactosaminidase family protein [Candidatus Poribacteria bacterium]
MRDNATLIIAALTLIILSGLAGISLAAEDTLLTIGSVSLDRTTVQPGGCIRATYIFTNIGDTTPLHDLTVFVHPRLVSQPENTYEMFGADFKPMLLTLYWQPDEVIVETNLICVPEDAPLGEYRLLIGFYEQRSGQRFRMGNDDLHFGDLRYEVAGFRVTQESVSPQPYDQTFIPVDGKIPSVVEPLETITLINEALEINLDAAAPVVYSILDRRTDERMLGAPRGILPGIGMCDKRNGWQYLWISALHGQMKVIWESSQAENTVIYTGEVRIGDFTAVAFDLEWELNGASFNILLTNVRESDGFDMMEVVFGELCAISERDGGHLVIPTDGGRDISVRNSGIGGREIRVNQFDALHTSILYRDVGQTILVSRPLGYENTILARIASPCEDIGKYASLGGRIIYRLPAQPPAAQFVAQETSGLELTFVNDMDSSGIADWIDGAKYLRQMITCAPNKLYCDSIVYKIYCASPPRTAATTFDECLDLIRSIHNLTDGIPQVVYLVGWQHDGHDTGYPDVSIVNPLLGGHDALLRLIQEARKLNAIVSFHDNYDDAYMDSPGWDQDMIARDSNGNLMRGGVWGGGQSYTISPLKYALKSGLERARYTVARYQIRDSYHIDVLSAVPGRHDYNSQSPAGICETLQGKFMIVDEFNKLGVDVTSECVTEPFIGIMTRMRHLIRRDYEHFSNEERIPLVAFVIHGHVIYGGAQLHHESHEGLLGSFINGQTFSVDWARGTSEQEILDLIYLLDLPMRALATREMQSYEHQGGTERVYYDDALVEVDWLRRTYRIVIDGYTVASDWTTMIPTSPQEILIYARDGRRIECPVPADMQSRIDRLTIHPLTANGPGEEVDFEYQDGVLVFTANHHRPYRLSVEHPVTKYDLNRDGIVNFLDLAIVIEFLGEKEFPSECDINEDDRINILDLIIVAWSAKSSL